MEGMLGPQGLLSPGMMQGNPGRSPLHQYRPPPPPQAHIHGMQLHQQHMYGSGMEGEQQQQQGGFMTERAQQGARVLGDDGGVGGSVGSVGPLGIVRFAPVGKGYV